mmetsp:Transcript_21179/g.27278  ORF Transcript_21179/g.27278 Transcript_21179/m.27278 type:complete len:95 (-) Transcript_21179:171-455(-)
MNLRRLNVNIVLKQTLKDERLQREATSEHIEGLDRSTISHEPSRHNRMVVHEIESFLQRYKTIFLELCQAQIISSIDHDALLKLNRQDFRFTIL